MVKGRPKNELNIWKYSQGKNDRNDFNKKSQEKNSKQSLTSEVAKDFKISGNINNKNVYIEN